MDNTETSEIEGVIKFQLDYTRKPPVASATYQQLNAWRGILLKLGLIGQDHRRYAGYGFGNISHKLNRDNPASDEKTYDPFIITGTQTGHLENLTDEHYAIVIDSSLDNNWVLSEGPIKPSSEALTHAAVYTADPSIRWVIHVHSPEIWRQTHHLSIPLVEPEIEYGTPEMASAVKRLLEHPTTREKSIFSMLGHDDGIVCFGSTAEETGLTVVRNLALALAFKKN